MPQVLRPESIGAITRTGNTTLTIAASTVNIGGQQRSFTSALTLTTSTVGANGIDTGAIAINQFYYVYLVNNNGVVAGVISLSGSAPTGFTASRLVGQCTTDSSGFLVAANSVTDDNAPVGHVLSAVLTEAQFRAIHGSGWILADGRSVSGSKYATVSGATTAPDLRGLALRGKNNGRADGLQNPDGEIGLGTAQGDTFGSHGHVNNWGDGVSGGTPNHSYIPNIVIGWSATGNPGTYGSSMIQPNGGNETRMKNATVNHFIKIN